MPRYFFDVQDGHTSRDEDGVELPDLRGAQMQAAEMGGRLLTDSAFQFWDHGELNVIVRDADGLVLVTLSMVGTRAPGDEDVIEHPASTAPAEPRKGLMRRLDQSSR